ncbi:MAG: hypothetical protein IT373_34585, partial [Polyangiaceae bacterium]|nr:hypothetical protein [Polyangiaceae bacterium]
VLAGLEAEHTLALTLAGDVADVEVTLDGVPLLGRVGVAAPVLEAAVTGAAALGAWRVRFGTFQRHATLHLRHLDAAAVEIGAGDVPLWGAPLVLNHHLQPAERLWAVADPGNGAMVQLLQALYGDRFVLVHNPDVWIQDELEWATATAPGARTDVAIDSIRDRELDGYVKSLAAPDVVPMTWGEHAAATTEDKFGNLETTPPHQAHGVSYPFGRVYYGDNGVVGPHAALKAMLDEQLVQAPLRVDTSWLCVGHVDEFMSFLADPAAPKGWKLVFADVPAAYELLLGLDPATSLPRYASTHGYATVGAILADAALTALNEDLQADYLDPILAGLMSELELGEADVVRVPALFERIPGCAYSSAFLEVAALLPAVVNYTVVAVDGEPSRVFLPDPFLRPSGAAQADDPLVQAVRALLPPSHELYFVDDWWTYHVAMGEVHCGTNVMRTPTPEAWVESAELLGGAP